VQEKDDRGATTFGFVYPAVVACRGAFGASRAERHSCGTQVRRCMRQQLCFLEVLTAEASRVEEVEGSRQAIFSGVPDVLLLEYGGDT
jgi:hypothetical protein